MLDFNQMYTALVMVRATKMRQRSFKRIAADIVEFYRNEQYPLLDASQNIYYIHTFEMISIKISRARASNDVRQLRIQYLLLIFLLSVLNYVM